MTLQAWQYTGSHVVQQLAYLGVQDFILVDGDLVEESNLNRLIGATRSDLGKPKTTVAKTVVQSVNKDARIRSIPKDIRTVEAFDAIKKADVIFGCFDNDGPRLIINQFALSYLTHYIDCATGISTDNNQIGSAGGRVIIIQPDGPCMERCTNMLDVEEASDNLTSKQEFENRKKLGYVKGADVPSPSVVSLNGTIASLAVSEFVKLVTGMRPVRTLTNHDFLEGREPSIVPCQVQIDKNCLHHSFIGIGDKIHLERFLKKEEKIA